ncbi:MAG: YqaJ viral recombinase family protein [Methylophilaceae bacterium]|nr:YqaJ viral recombinase family protein [Methylophilaceae bacterium]
MNNLQGSNEWFQQRLGKVTASVIHKLLSDKATISRKLLLKSLVMERISGTPTRHVKSSDMQRGLNLEPKAIEAYENQTQQKIVNVGFIAHPNIEMAGASPDGLIENMGLIEIKCLNLHNHNQIIKSKKIPKQYFNQIQFQLACTKREWADFVAFHPEADHILYIERVYPDTNVIQWINDKVRIFLCEVDKLYLQQKKSNLSALHQYI